jgi:hypothetical protein
LSIVAFDSTVFHGSFVGLAVPLVAGQLLFLTDGAKALRG